MIKYLFLVKKNKQFTFFPKKVYTSKTSLYK